MRASACWESDDKGRLTCSRREICSTRTASARPRRRRARRARAPAHVFDQLFGDDVKPRPPPRIPRRRDRRRLRFLRQRRRRLRPGAKSPTPTRPSTTPSTPAATPFRTRSAFTSSPPPAATSADGYSTGRPRLTPGRRRSTCRIFTSAATAFPHGEQGLPSSNRRRRQPTPRAPSPTSATSPSARATSPALSDEAWKARGTPTGTVQGRPREGHGRARRPRARLLLPEPGRDVLPSTGSPRRARPPLRCTGSFHAADADGWASRLVLDGSFHATSPPAEYAVVARTQDGMALRPSGDQGHDGADDRGGSGRGRAPLRAVPRG